MIGVRKKVLEKVGRYLGRSGGVGEEWGGLGKNREC